MFQLIPSTQLARIVHAVLHKRIADFAEKYTPLSMVEHVVNSWLNRFYCGDPNIIILIENDRGFNITSHALIEVQHIGELKIICAHQLEFDKRGSDGKFDAFAKLLDDLCVHVDAEGVCIEVSKGVRVFEKKYGYTNTRTLMYKGNVSKVQDTLELEEAG